MNRRTFLFNSMLFTGGSLVFPTLPSFARIAIPTDKRKDLYESFRYPDMSYHPFVRWWWNGNKIEAGELVRELGLLREAGIGGVEINPVEFPSRQEGDDLGKPSLEWLSSEWIDMLQVAWDEAGRLGMTCDLIVGSGWPFGAETLARDERASVVLLDAIALKGPMSYEISQFTIFKNADPGVTVPCPGRTFDLIDLRLVPDPISSTDEAIDLNMKINDEVIKVEVPPGQYFLYSLVRVDSFASVINGAPGASGPILNHMDRKAVGRYLKHMSDTIQKQTGPLSTHIRSLFTDSMELEGSNWTDDFPSVFREKRGYDLMPWLPFLFFKVGRLGGVVDFDYGASKTPGFYEEVNRVRYDYELTKAELFNERFNQTYLEWCKQLGVLSRAQSYGRGFFPLRSSLGYDIPEGESWTTNWLKHTVGEEMPDDDYRRGRAYTMINKYVSSAAHLEGKRLISCEEMTNTYRVFNTSLELLKIGSDQSIMSGITHSVWHGFNYSPPDAPYPGWIQYGSYYNEKNNWWPYFKHLNAYKSRISALLQNAEMYTDIAILPDTSDLWSEWGVQTEPFPERLISPYTSLIWESINKNGGAADYITERIINSSIIKKGFICYGSRQYSALILPGVSRIMPETLSSLYDFISGGGKILCIDKLPDKSPGMADYRRRDREVREGIEKLRKFTGSFIMSDLPDEVSFLEWYSRIMKEHKIPNYIEIDEPDPFLMQVRYRTDEGKEIIFFSNSHISRCLETGITFTRDITRGRYGWVWNPETGLRYRIKPGMDGKYVLKLGPAESRIFVFDHNRTGREWKEIPVPGENAMTVPGPWQLEFKHCRNRPFEAIELKELADLKEKEGYTHFSGTLIYRKEIIIGDQIPAYIDLGKVYNISEVKVNGQDAGLKWYGNHIYNIEGLLGKGANELEIRVITLMGNYMKSLEDNPNAQYWTNLGRKMQPLVSLGLVGPVKLY